MDKSVQSFHEIRIMQVHTSNTLSVVIIEQCIIFIISVVHIRGNR